jgi:GMP synthase (glutamine-hydrolysing)
VPEGAVLLMTGEACPAPMFRVRRNVYATQFHREGDAEGFATRIHVYKHHGYFQPHEVDSSSAMRGEAGANERAFENGAARIRGRALRFPFY